jgi:isoleucyl-tRNA synthetase
MTIMREDVDIHHEDIKGWVVETDNELTVALDTELTDELLAEGFAREFVNRVQNMRKDAGFEVTDRIKIYYNGEDQLKNVLTAQGEYVKRETLAVELVGSLPQSGGSPVKCDIDGKECWITIERVRSNGAQ